MTVIISAYCLIINLLSINDHYYASIVIVIMTIDELVAYSNYMALPYCFYCCYLVSYYYCLLYCYCYHSFTSLTLII